ncbi:MAG: YezD family protein [bacterium]
MNGPKNKARIVDKKVNVEENIKDAVLADICKALQEIRYGSVQIHIQDSKVIQIDKVNKVRMR